MDSDVDTQGLQVCVKDGWHPFNLQATLWESSDMHLVYLPSCCDFRMKDSFRGYVAQCILKKRAGLYKCWNILIY